MLLTHRVGARHDLPVVLPHGLASPADGARVLRQVNVNQKQIGFADKHVQNLFYEGLQRTEVRVSIIDRSAKGDGP
jgi:hypothetical protein